MYASDKRIQKICHQYKIFANYSNRYAKRKGNNKSPKPSHDNLIQRQFKTNKPNQVWLSDITEHQTKEGKLYWCGFKDCFSNLIIGQAMNDRMTTNLVEEALLNALQNRNYPKNVIIHTDRGSQYNSTSFKRMLKKYGLKGSMGQVHTCADNAAMESFNSQLQKCVFNQKKVWDTKQELRLKTFRWVTVRYNQEKRQKNLLDMTPLEYDIIVGGQQLNIE